MSGAMTLEEVVNETIVMLKSEGRMPWRAKIVAMQTTESQVTVTMSLGPRLTIDINSPRQSDSSERRALRRFLASERKNRAPALYTQAGISASPERTVVAGWQIKRFYLI